MDLEGQPARDACQRVRRRTLNEDGRFSHSYLVRSYNGHYLGLSIRRREFDSPTHRQVFGVDALMVGQQAVTLWLQGK